MCSPNVANLKRIVCNAHEPVLLRVLVCKDEKAAGVSGICPYPDHKNSGAVRLSCDDCKNVLAQIYLRLEQPDRSRALRSCIIAFVEGTYLSKTDDLVARLQHSVEWLDIKRERPLFYIFCYGEPLVKNTANNAFGRIDDRIREIFDFYPEGEDTCVLSQVRRDSEALIINPLSLFQKL
jgi:hypothetical protein